MITLIMAAKVAFCLMVIVGITLLDKLLKD